MRLLSKMVQGLDVDDSNVPSHIMDLDGMKEEGPNCWNATIMFFDDSEEVRFVSEEEMKQWLNENTEKDTHKICAPGTILAMYNDSGLIHTAVYVGKGTLFHKRGCGGK